MVINTPKGEELHSQAMLRYWTDAEFHTRCTLLFNALYAHDTDEMTRLVYALHIDDAVRLALSNRRDEMSSSE